MSTSLIENLDVFNKKIHHYDRKQGETWQVSIRGPPEIFISSQLESNEQKLMEHMNQA